MLTQALEGGSLSDLVDPSLKDYIPCEMARMIACAGACVRVSARDQPQMSEVNVLYYTHLQFCIKEDNILLQDKSKNFFILVIQQGSINGVVQGLNPP